MLLLRTIPVWWAVIVDLFYVGAALVLVAYLLRGRPPHWEPGVVTFLFVTTVGQRAVVADCVWPPVEFLSGPDATLVLGLRFALLGFVVVRTAGLTSIPTWARVGFAVLAGTVVAGWAWGAAQAWIEWSLLGFCRVTVKQPNGTSTSYLRLMLEDEFVRGLLISAYAAVVGCATVVAQTWLVRGQAGERNEA